MLSIFTYSKAFAAPEIIQYNYDDLNTPIIISEPLSIAVSPVDPAIMLDNTQQFIANGIYQGGVIAFIKSLSRELGPHR